MSALEAALRRNRGRLLRPEYLQTASRWLGRPVDSVVTLSLEATDHLRQTMHAHPHQVQRFEGPDARARVRTRLGRLRLTNEAGPMVVLARGSEYCGGLLSDLSEVVDHAFDIAALDGEDLRAYALDGSRGLWVIWETEVAPDGSVQPVLEVHLMGGSPGRSATGGPLTRGTPQWARTGTPAQSPLMAFRLANVQPSVVINVTGVPLFESRLTYRLGTLGELNIPSFVPRIRRVRWWLPRDFTHCRCRLTAHSVLRTSICAVRRPSSRTTTRPTMAPCVWSSSSSKACRRADGSCMSIVNSPISMT